MTRIVDEPDPAAIRKTKNRKIREFLNRTAIYGKHSTELKEAIREDIIRAENEEREELRKTLRWQMQKNEKEVGGAFGVIGGHGTSMARRVRENPICTNRTNRDVY